MSVAAGAVERLAATGSELWWDSSPLIFRDWVEETVGKAPAAAKDALRAQIERMLRFEDLDASVLRGVTTNPPLCLAVVKGEPATWERWAERYRREHPGADAKGLCWAVYQEVVRRSAALLLPLFESSGGRHGQVTGQVDPRLLHDTDAMVAQAVELSALSPNVSVKMPGTREGIEGVRRLTARGISTTTTLVFTVAQLVAVAEAVKAGLAEARGSGVDLSRWRALGVMMLGRFEDARLFHEQAADLGVEVSESDRRWAGIAVFKRAYRLYRERGYETKLLAASMRLGPTVDGRQSIWHLEELAGADAVLTIFPNIYEGWINAYAGRPIAPRVDEDVPAGVLEKLLRIPYFREGYEENGLSPEGFAGQAAVVETATAFAAAMDELEAWCAGRLARL